MEAMIGRKGQRFLALDSLRGVCACAVALYHLKTTGFITNLPFILNGPLFVDFFFVLSGFVIMRGYGDKLANGAISLRQFLLLRIGRVYPLHLVMLLAFLGIRTAGALAGSRGAIFNAEGSFATFASNLALVQIFVPPPELGWNIPSWSIAAELWTYLIVGLLIVVAARHVRWAIPALTVIAAVLLLAVIDQHEAPVHSGALFRCVYGFGCGCLASWAWERVGPGLQTISPRLATLIEVAAVGAALSFVAFAGTPALVAAPPVFFLVILVFAADRGVVSAALRYRPTVAIGAWSYSIYMVHYFIERRALDVVSVLEKLLHRPLLVRGGSSPVIDGPGLFADIAALAILAGVILVSWLTHRAVELPGQRWSRRKVLGERKPSEIAAAERIAPTF